MMSYYQIRRMDTTVDSIPPGCKGVHESVLRAYQILERVKWLLSLGTNAAVVVELIAFMENKPEYPTCSECGKEMVPSGSCFKCENCGSTSGCS